MFCKMRDRDHPAGAASAEDEGDVQMSELETGEIAVLLTRNEQDLLSALAVLKGESKADTLRLALKFYSVMQPHWQRGDTLMLRREGEIAYLTEIGPWVDLITPMNHDGEHPLSSVLRALNGSKHVDLPPQQ